MDKKKISTAPLKSALESLKRSAAQPLNEFTRDSTIQRFEYTFELCWKLLQKILESDRPLADPSIKGILREAARMGLIQNLERWFELHEGRNLTSHTYNIATAEEVYAKALLLPAEVDFLLKAIQARLQAKS